MISLVFEESAVFLSEESNFHTGITLGLNVCAVGTRIATVSQAGADVWVLFTFDGNIVACVIMLMLKWTPPSFLSAKVRNTPWQPAKFESSFRLLVAISRLFHFSLPLLLLLLRSLLKLTMGACSSYPALYFWRYRLIYLWKFSTLSFLMLKKINFFYLLLPWYSICGLVFAILLGSSLFLYILLKMYHFLVTYDKILETFLSGSRKFY